MKNNKYSDIISKHAIKPKLFKNALIAFVTGGSIGIIGQLLIDLYVNVFNFEVKDAQSFMIVTLILVTALLTGFGVYDIFGAFAGAGSFVPITGFSNAMTSAAIEGRSEGVTLGIGANMFKLAGSVIVFGVVSAYIIGTIRYIFFM
jgi:stage V sporulation protein AC